MRGMGEGLECPEMGACSPCGRVHRPVWAVLRVALDRAAETPEPICGDQRIDGSFNWVSGGHHGARQDAREDREEERKGGTEAKKEGSATGRVRSDREGTGPLRGVRVTRPWSSVRQSPFHCRSRSDRTRGAEAWFHDNADTPSTRQQPFCASGCGAFGLWISRFGTSEQPSFLPRTHSGTQSNRTGTTQRRRSLPGRLVLRNLEP